MLIPLSHENLRGRRWPYITIVIIALNLVVFLATHWAMTDETRKLGEVRAHILMLVATHPGVQMTPEVRKFVEHFQRDNAKLWERARSPYRQLEDAWDARMRLMEPEQAQEEMDSLCERYAQLQSESLLAQYAFAPADHSPVTYVTANFLHGGWLHLIFNMWFLWLAGSILEDTWGRVIYPLFYFAAGTMALIVHATVYPDSMVPTLGASGAVAGLMGAFLVRFPKTKIQMAWVIFLFFRFRVYRFKASAYTLLPLWLTTEILYGVLFGSVTGVAHWAHIGGFLFGALAAVTLRTTGIEQKADQAIEAKVTWTADPHIVAATDLLERNQPDAAIAQVQSLLAEKPDSVEAHDLLQKIYWRKQDLAGYREELATLCRLYVNAREMGQAWQAYEDFTNAGGDKLHKAVWTELCRYLEKQQTWDRAAVEYEKLARAYAKDRAGLAALVAAARIQFKQLGRRDEALRLYRAAQASPVPHLDLEQAIRTGLAECSSYAGVPVSSVRT